MRRRQSSGSAAHLLQVWPRAAEAASSSGGLVPRGMNPHSAFPGRLARRGGALGCRCTECSFGQLVHVSYSGSGFPVPPRNGPHQQPPNTQTANQNKRREGCRDTCHWETWCCGKAQKDCRKKKMAKYSTSTPRHVESKTQWKRPSGTLHLCAVGLVIAQRKQNSLDLERPTCRADQAAAVLPQHVVRLAVLSRCRSTEVCTLFSMAHG